MSEKERIGRTGGPGTAPERNAEETGEMTPEMAAEAAGCPCCGGRSKVRDPKEQKDLINRLNRIEGQIRGIRGMLENDAYCIDILNQVSAANSALNSFTKVLLAQHIRTCVAEDLHQGNDEKLEELVKTLQKLMR